MLNMQGLEGRHRARLRIHFPLRLRTRAEVGINVNIHYVHDQMTPELVHGPYTLLVYN